MIDDLRFKLEYAKYVDDTTVYSVSCDPQDAMLQAEAENLIWWAQHNSMLVSESKTKELIIHFGKLIDIDTIENIVMNGRTIEWVQSFKLLGIHISADLSWDMHVDHLIKKVSKRFICIRYLVNAGVRDVDIVEIFAQLFVQYLNMPVLYGTQD